MRLDTLGKPPLLQNDHFEKIGVGKVKRENIGEISHPQESGTSTSSEGGERLGKILNLFEELDPKKKKRGRYKKKSDQMDFNVESDPLDIYKMIARGRFKPTKGQHLDVKV